MLSPRGRASLFLLFCSLFLSTSPPALAKESYRYVSSFCPFGCYEPSGLAFDADNRLYVADLTWNTDTKDHAIFQCRPGGTVLGSWGPAGFEPGQFHAAAGIAVRGRETIYVADEGNCRVQQFTTEGSLVRSWGGHGDAQGQFQYPWDVALDPSTGDVFVADSWRQRIAKFTATGQFLCDWKTHGTYVLDTPNAVATDSAGYVYVSDSASSLVKKYTRNGAFVCQWASPGVGGLTVDRARRVYAVDVLHQQIRKTTATGTLLCAWGPAAGEPGRLALQPFSHPAVQADGTVWVTSSIGAEPMVRCFRPNHAPGVTRVVVNPAAPRDSADLVAKAAGSDVDGDVLRYRYRWEYTRDGTLWVAGPPTRRVAASLTHLLERWRVRVQASDGLLSSRWVVSDPVVIGGGFSPRLLALAATRAGNGRSTLRVTLSAPATAQLTIRTLAGRTVAVLPERVLPGGDSTLTWSGLSATGTRVPAGRYLVTLTARGNDGSKSSLTAALLR